VTVRQLLFRGFNFFPDYALKGFLAGIYYRLLFSLNNTWEKKFRLTLEDGYFRATFNGKSYTFAINPLDELKFSFHGYLKNHHLQKGDVVVDGGAFPGEFALVCSSLVGDEGKVIAFEPDPHNYWHVKELLERNGIKNVILLNSGLWNTDTVLKFDSNKAISSKVLVGECGANSDAIEIKCVSLDRELERLGIDKVSFIKFDIEGAEMNALLGAKNLLLRDDVSLAIASYHIVEGEMTFGPVEKILKDFGYQAFTQNLVRLTPGHESFTTFAGK
jgi:FkbM family methyltransferase